MQDIDTITLDIFNRLDENRMVIIRSTDELKQFIKTRKDLISHFIFQEYVHGYADSMYTVGIYANKDHEIRGLFTGRKVRGFPPDIGDCIVGQSEEIPTGLIKMVKEFVKESQYHGIAEFEFKKDTRTGEFKLIEVNPRSWSWIGITPACDVSLPMIAYTDLTGRTSMPCKCSKARAGEVKYVKLLEDFWNCIHANKMAGFPAYSMTPRQWWRSLDAKKTIYAEFSWDDPLIALYSIFNQFIAISDYVFTREVKMMRVPS